jgi:predicted O-methyltransferase YrrM
MYWRRRYPNYAPVPGMMSASEDLPQFRGLSPDQLVPMLDKPGLYPMDVLGTGCLAIRRDVFEGWSDECRPIFDTMLAVDGEDIVTEDVWFSWKLKQQGIQPMLDTAVCCGHNGSLTIGRDTYLQGIGRTVSQPQIDGWLTENEAKLLSSCTEQACQREPTAAIVELGSLYGKSTAVIGSAAKALGVGCQVYAIDPHEGDLGLNTKGERLSVGVDTFDRFCQNMMAAGLQDVIIPVRQRSTDVDLDEPISLLYIDAQHDRESVLADFGHFEELLTADAIVLFHDYGQSVFEVSQAVGEILQDREWCVLARADSVIALQRSSSKAGVA